MNKYLHIKVRVRLTNDQKRITNDLFRLEEIVYNAFLDKKISIYKNTKVELGTYEFSLMWNNGLKYEYDSIIRETLENYQSYSATAIQHAMMDADSAFKCFFNKQNKFPKYKSEQNLVRSFFFEKRGIRMHQFDIGKLWIPILHDVNLCEKGYLIPDMMHYVSSGRIVYDHGNYYVVLILKNYPDPRCKAYNMKNKSNDGVGIDIGVKHLLTINGSLVKYVENPIFTKKYKQITEKIRHLKKICIHKASVNLIKFGLPENTPISKVPKELLNLTYRTHEIMKLRKRISKLLHKQTMIRQDLIKKSCKEIIDTHPQYIAIEDLDTESMIKKAKSSMTKRIIFSGFRYIRRRIIQLGDAYDIPIHIIYKFYPSSNTCPICGYVRQSTEKLKLSNRMFVCPQCKWKLERDMNAALNIKNCIFYSIATINN